ncbi:hypothetical protein ACKFKG_10465 [Phormidesmis sp. 146-35]
MEVEMLIELIQADIGTVGCLQQSAPPCKFRPYWRPEVANTLCKRLGCVSSEEVKLVDRPLMLRGEALSYHNLYHFEVSCLDRIVISNQRVSGIHGFYASMFCDAPIEAEYAGVLDEARVAVHEWLTRPAFYNTLKLINWSIWLVWHGINPIAVILRHAESLGRFARKYGCSIVEVAPKLCCLYSNGKRTAKRK